MSRGQTIKGFVEQRLREGASAETIWREAQQRFPHRCVSWGYVLSLKRKQDKAQEAA